MKKLLPVAFAFLAPAASALFIDHDTYSTDTATQLRWLDVSATAGYTFNQVMDGAGGYINDGWRAATGGEVRDLFSRYLGTEPETFQEGLSFFPAYWLVSQMGVTMSWNTLQGGVHFTDPNVPNQISLDGFFDDGNGYAEVGLAEIIARAGDYNDPINPGSRWVAYDDWVTPNYNNPGRIGTFLVRDNAVRVSEPAPFGLIAIGIAALGWRRYCDSRRA